MMSPCEINLLCKSVDWFLFDRDLRHELMNQWVNHIIFPEIIWNSSWNSLTVMKIYIHESVAETVAKRCSSVLKSFENLKVKYLCWSFLFNKVACCWSVILLKKRSLAQVFSRQFLKNFQNSFFMKHFFWKLCFHKVYWHKMPR